MTGKIPFQKVQQCIPQDREFVRASTTYELHLFLHPFDLPRNIYNKPLWRIQSPCQKLSNNGISKKKMIHIIR